MVGRESQSPKCLQCATTCARGPSEGPMVAFRIIHNAPPKNATPGAKSIREVSPNRPSPLQLIEIYRASAPVSTSEWEESHPFVTLIARFAPLMARVSHGLNDTTLLTLPRLERPSSRSPTPNLCTKPSASSSSRLPPTTCRPVAPRRRWQGHRKGRGGRHRSPPARYSSQRL